MICSNSGLMYVVTAVVTVFRNTQLSETTLHLEAIHLYHCVSFTATPAAAPMECCKGGTTW